MTAHYDDDVLAVFAFDPEGFAGRAAVEQHLAICDDCRARLEVITRIDVALRSEEMWKVTDELTTAHGRTRYRDAARKKRLEDEDAERLLANIAHKPMEFAFLNLARERLRTAGCVRLLCRVAHHFCESNPLHARNVADAAIRIAAALRGEVYGASAVNLLRASAHCERANALRYLGEFDEAHAALDRASAALDRAMVPPVEHARVDYIRATVRWKQRDFAVALRLVRLAAATFARYGERSRQVDAKIIEANILFDRGEPLAALEILGPLYDSVDEPTEPLLAARLANNVGYCYLKANTLTLASDYFQRALRGFEQLGLTAEVVGTRWNIACLALASGDRAGAIRRFRAVRQQFESLEMLHEAALVILELMDALLSIGETSKIPQLASTVADHVFNSGAVGSALIAAAFVRQAASAGTLERSGVRYVRHYLAEVQQNPALLFVPPPQEHQM